MEKLNTLQPLFPHLPDRLAGLEELAENLVESINREAAPISRVMGKDGRQLVVKVPLTDPPIHIAVWKVAVGRVFLYLMDTDVEITARKEANMSLFTPGLFTPVSKLVLVIFFLSAALRILKAYERAVIFRLRLP